MLFYAKAIKIELVGNEYYELCRVAYKLIN